MFPSNPWRICSRVGEGFVRSNSFAARIMPGVQNPHCRPWLIPERFLERVQVDAV